MTGCEFACQLGAELCAALRAGRTGALVSSGTFALESIAVGEYNGSGVLTLAIIAEFVLFNEAKGSAAVTTVPAAVAVVVVVVADTIRDLRQSSGTSQRSGADVGIEHHGVHVRF